VTSTETAPGVRVGVDTADVSEVAASIARFGDRYLGRIYTPGEIADCQGSPSVMARGLAARFAAKEATLKVLRPSGVSPGWRTIEVRRAAGGWPELHLRGLAEAMATEAGLGDLSVSLTHQGELATAVVVGVCQVRSGERSDDGCSDPAGAR
jgi:holo-[acyl-carrier protein] synthase